MTAERLALELKLSLTESGLVNYAKEMTRIIVNEIKMGHSVKVHNLRLKAAMIAILMDDIKKN